MEQLATQHGLAFKPEIVSTLNEHDFIYLRRGDDKQESHAILGDHQGCDVRVFDYSHTSAPNYYTKHWHTLITSTCASASDASVPDFVITPGHYLERYLVQMDEMPMSEGAFADNYRLFADQGSEPQRFISSELVEFLMQHDDYYLEVRKGVMLAFRRNHSLASAEELAQLFKLVECFNRSCEEAKG